MKSPEVSVRFASCSSVSLSDTNWEQIFSLPKPSRTIVCAMSLLLPNFSAINLSVSRRSCARYTRTSLILSRFLPFAKAFEPLVNIFSAHGVSPVHLHQHFTRLRCSFPQLVAVLDVCMLFHCAVTLPQSIHTASHMQSILPISLKNHAPSCRSDMTPFIELFRHTCTHHITQRQVVVQIWLHSSNFLDTPCTQTTY